MSSRLVQLGPRSGSGGGLFHKPLLHVDELGLTSDKYLGLNESTGSLPLKLSFSPMAPARHRLMSHFQQALESQKDLGFADSDIDDVRRLISDTSVYLLAVTLVASVLHLLFEFLAFKSDINFWRKNKSLTGLSVRTLFIDLFFQLTILLYLADTDTSLLVTVPSAVGVLIQGWKCQRATGLVVQWGRASGEASWLPFKLVATRMVHEAAEGETAEGETAEGEAAEGEGAKKSKEAKEEEAAQAKRSAELAKESMRIDRLAISHMSMALFPLVCGFALRSLVMEQHHGWYSWAIAALTGACYTFGFILMTPQLFINHHLKSVSHLPWRFLCFRFVNTFIDDLFAFIVRMPTMHRISCFRDDLVFFVYLYQRWAYPVDESRGVAIEDMGS
mmetsp:Transcript_46588/g.105275  ORF Transcript_46588/g.105275 Transcript_46588/m.105275 type:complete len:389 (-) Transcript_46588:521-1687(-)